MNERTQDCIKDILSDRECRAVTKLIEEVNEKKISADSVGLYIQEIKNTLNTISHRKEMLTHALYVLEKYVDQGQRGNFEFEESIKGSQLLDA
ncbi:MAG: hypothetical protein OXK80_01570 [Bdellovibrionales bacterium]|nr:hypothetical protein [Bdellovibrionales bacterium]